jgi:LAO/AO transport system kinase
VSDAATALGARLLDRDERALGRVISGIESGDGSARALLRELRAHGAVAAVVGVTGTPGSGKSTLVDALVALARARGERVAVVAVDPSSPYSGGAILGDRIRMSRWQADPDVFVRSMAARGQLGGLAAAALQVVALLEAVGFERIFVETVGVGQSEVEVAAGVDTTLVLLTPGQGDGVQAVKAGLMEVADVFVVNKADHPGAERLVTEVRGAQGLVPPAEARDWTPPVLTTVASRAEGVQDVDAAIARHRAHVAGGGGAPALRRSRVRSEVRALVAAAVRRALARVPDADLDAVAAGEHDADAIAAALLRRAVDGGA